MEDSSTSGVASGRSTPAQTSGGGGSKPATPAPPSSSPPNNVTSGPNSNVTGLSIGVAHSQSGPLPPPSSSSSMVTSHPNRYGGGGHYQPPPPPMSATGPHGPPGPPPPPHMLHPSANAPPPPHHPHGGYGPPHGPYGGHQMVGGPPPPHPHHGPPHHGAPTHHPHQGPPPPNHPYAMQPMMMPPPSQYPQQSQQQQKLPPGAQPPPPPPPMPPHMSQQQQPGGPGGQQPPPPPQHVPMMGDGRSSAGPYGSPYGPPPRMSGPPPPSPYYNTMRHQMPPATQTQQMNKNYAGYGGYQGPMAQNQIPPPPPSSSSASSSTQSSTSSSAAPGGHHPGHGPPPPPGHHPGHGPPPPSGHHPPPPPHGHPNQMMMNVPPPGHHPGHGPPPHGPHPHQMPPHVYGNHNQQMPAQHPNNDGQTGSGQLPQIPTNNMNNSSNNNNNGVPGSSSSATPSSTTTTNTMVNNNNSNPSSGGSGSNGNGLRLPQPPSIMDEVSQTSTASSQAADDSCASSDMQPGSATPSAHGSNSKHGPKHHLSHPPTPNTSNLGSPGAASMSSFHDDFDSVSSPSWPRTPASPAINSSQFDSHVHNSKRPDNVQKLYEMSDEPDRKLFLDKYFQFLDERGTPLNQVPTISKIPVDLYRLYMLVKERGGYLEVTRAKMWKDCAQLCNIANSSSASYTLRKQYMKHLLAFECKFDRGGIDVGPLLSAADAANVNRKKQPNSKLSNSGRSTPNTPRLSPNASPGAVGQSPYHGHHGPPPPPHGHPPGHPGMHPYEMDPSQQNSYPNQSGPPTGPPPPGAPYHHGPYGPPPPQSHGPPPPHPEYHNAQYGQPPPGVPPPPVGQSTTPNQNNIQSGGNHESVSVKDPFADEDPISQSPRVSKSSAPNYGRGGQGHYSLPNNNSYYGQQPSGPPPPPNSQPNAGQPPAPNSYGDAGPHYPGGPDSGYPPRSNATSDVQNSANTNNAAPVPYGQSRMTGMNGPIVQHHPQSGYPPYANQYGQQQQVGSQPGPYDPLGQHPSAQQSRSTGPYDQMQHQHHPSHPGYPPPPQGAPPPGSHRYPMPPNAANSGYGRGPAGATGSPYHHGPPPPSHGHDGPQTPSTPTSQHGHVPPPAPPTPGQQPQVQPPPSQQSPYPQTNASATPAPGDQTGVQRPPSAGGYPGSKDAYNNSTRMQSALAQRLLAAKLSQNNTNNSNSSNNVSQVSSTTTSPSSTPSSIPISSTAISSTSVTSATNTTITTQTTSNNSTSNNSITNTTSNSNHQGFGSTHPSGYPTPPISASTGSNSSQPSTPSGKQSNIPPAPLPSSGSANTNISWMSSPSVRYSQPKRHPDFVKQSPDASAYPPPQSHYGGGPSSAGSAGPRSMPPPPPGSSPPSAAAWNRTNDNQYGRMPGPAGFYHSSTGYQNNNQANSGPTSGHHSSSRDGWHDTRGPGGQIPANSSSAADSPMTTTHWSMNRGPSNAGYSGPAGGYPGAGQEYSSAHGQGHYPGAPPATNAGNKMPPTSMPQYGMRTNDHQNSRSNFIGQGPMPHGHFNASSANASSGSKIPNAMINSSTSSPGSATGPPPPLFGSGPPGPYGSASGPGGPFGSNVPSGQSSVVVHHQQAAGQQSHHSSHHPSHHSGPMAVAAAAAMVARREMQPIFPPNSVEATVPMPSRRRKLMARDIAPVEAWRIYMSLKSGLLAESTFALDVLNVYSNDDNTLIYLSLPNMPGLLEVLLEHYRRYLNEMFDSIFADIEIGYEQNQKNSDVATSGSFKAYSNGTDSKKIKNMNGKRTLKWYELDRDLLEDNDETNGDDDDDIEKFLDEKFHLGGKQKLTLFGDSTSNYTNVTRNGKQVKVKKDKNIFIMDYDKKWDRMTDRIADVIKNKTGHEHWVKGGGETTTHIQSHMEPKEKYLRFCRLIKSSKKLKTSDDDSSVMDIDDNDDGMTNGNGQSHEEETTTDGLQTFLNNENQYPKIHPTDRERYWKRLHQPDLEDESYDQEEPTVCTGREYQDSIKSRCLTVSNLIRNLTFVPGNDVEMCRSSCLLLILSRLILLHHVHAIKKKRKISDLDCTKISTKKLDDETMFKLLNEDKTDSSDYNGNCNGGKFNGDSTLTLPMEKEWWWEALHLIRENTMVTLANISGQLDLSSFPESITLSLLDGLLHWAVCPSSYAQDAFPSAPTTLSPRRLAYEALSKLSIYESNVDLILATPPWSRIEKFLKNLTKSLLRNEDQTIREFSIVLISNFATADPSVARVIALSGYSVSLLLGFIEQAEQSALNMANTHGLQYLRENFDAIGTTPDMVRRAASILRTLARYSENHSLFIQHEQRLLSLTMSQILDQSISSIIADILFECSLDSSSTANNPSISYFSNMISGNATPNNLNNQTPNITTTSNSNMNQPSVQSESSSSS